MRVALINAHTAYARGATFEHNGIIRSEYQFSSQINKEVVNILSTSQINSFIVDASQIQPYNSSLNYKAFFVDDQKPDIAIETHFNSSDNKKASGFEVLYSKGRETSKQLAICMVEGLKKYLPFLIRRENGLFEVDNIYLLKSVNCPIVITESLFLSNPFEQQYLLFPNAIKILSNAIAEGIFAWSKLYYQK
jgi:N-acetylmuramoyl-L-alanine amidase